MGLGVGDGEGVSVEFVVLSRDEALLVCCVLGVTELLLDELVTECFGVVAL